MTNPKVRYVYIIAGEPSGDLLGARLMRELKAQSSIPLLFAGVGGEKMKAEGLKSLFPYEELALFGMVEIIPHILNILARVNQTATDIITKEPAAIITIDCPGFCKRVVRKVRKAKLESFYVHYVAPSVWAWRPKRAESYAELYDHMLCLLPFEPPLFERLGLAASFVGHTVVAESTVGDGNAFRERYKLAPETPLFCILPGSRKGEIIRHLPIFARMISLLAQTYPNLAFVLPIPKYLLEMVRPYFEGCPYRAIVTANEHDKHDGIAASNVAIVKSGTVTLEVARANVPMIVAYRVNTLSAFLYRRLRLTKLVNLINILLGREAIPELLQDDCTPQLLASAAANLLTNQPGRTAQQAAMMQALAMMTPQNSSPSAIAASIILEKIR